MPNNISGNDLLLIFLFLIPCHRVIRANGSTGGYVLGENTKEYLIELEKNAK